MWENINLWIWCHKDSKNLASCIRCYTVKPNMAFSQILSKFMMKQRKAVMTIAFCSRSSSQRAETKNFHDIGDSFIFSKVCQYICHSMKNRTFFISYTQSSRVSRRKCIDRIGRTRENQKWITDEKKKKKCKTSFFFSVVNFFSVYCVLLPLCCFF